MSGAPEALDLSTVPGAPAKGTLLARSYEIGNNRALPLAFADGNSLVQIFILNHKGALTAWVNSCPHVRLPLDWIPGAVMDEARTHLFCTNHKARFRVTDGLCVEGPCLGKYLQAVKIEVRDGNIYAA